MSELESFNLSAEGYESLRSLLARQADTVTFAAEPGLASLVACLGIQREVGTINDEMARFVFDADTGLPIAPERLSAELVRYRGAFGVRIRARDCASLDLRFHGIRALLNPRFSFSADGRIRQFVIFPESVARIAQSQGVELVLVRPWALNTIFGGFDPSGHYYQTNFWELENNDSLRFARLIQNRTLPFLGTHDLVAHVAGVQDMAWPSLAAVAKRVGDTLEDYFGEIRVPTIASLVIPYTTGVVLDDLAQPPNYGAAGRLILIDELLRSIQARSVDPERPLKLLRFPSAYEKLIRLGRNLDSELVRTSAPGGVRELVRELGQHSVALFATV